MLTSQVHAQTLKTGSHVVELHACSDAKEFSVRIAKGSKACADGILKMEVPAGFEFIPGSAKVEGTAVKEKEYSTNSMTIELPLIPAGPISEEIEITFEIKALCEIIGEPVGLNVVTYTFSNCETEQVGQSEAINILYAVMRINVTPSPIFVDINQEVERTVTIINQGNGEVPRFVIERALGDNITHISYDFSKVTGWTVDATDSEKIIFTGGLLKSGHSFTYTEKVKIISCELTPTDYEVYYGCSVKCERSSVNGHAKHIINIKAANAPSLRVHPNNNTKGCFNTFIPQSWEITNTGDVDTEEIEFSIGTTDFEGHIDPSSIKINGVSVTVDGPSQVKPTSVTFKIPALKSKEKIELTFEQFISAPEGTAAECLNAPISFTNNGSYYEASFDYVNACAPVFQYGTVVNEVTYSFDGKHIGEIDLIQGQGFEGDFLFSDFNIPSAGLAIGDMFSIVITLSDGLEVANLQDFVLSLKGTTLNPVASGTGPEYRLTFTYGDANWPTGTDLKLPAGRLRFPISFSCPMDPDQWYRIGGELVKQAEDNSPCAAIVFNCKETDLKADCSPGVCVNGLQNGTASLSRENIGFAVDANGVPDVSTNAQAKDVQLRTFIIGDVLNISQVSRAVVEAGKNYTKVRLTVEKDLNTTTVLVKDSGKVILTRAGNSTEFTDLTVKDENTHFVLDFDISSNSTTLTSIENDDQITLSLQFKVTGAVDELAKFPSNSYLVTATEALKCGRDYTATGFYVPVGYNFSAGTANFKECQNNTAVATFTTTVFNIDKQDAIFTNEFRPLFKATSAVLMVPETVELTGVKVNIKNQGWLGASTNIADISSLTITNDSYELDLEQLISNHTQSALFDEGFVLEIIPTVSLLGCEPELTQKQVAIGVIFEGLILDGQGVESPYIQEADIKFNTGVGTFNAKVAAGDKVGIFNEDGTMVSWVVEVKNSGARNFNSVWLSKQSGGLDILSIQEGAQILGENRVLGGAEILPNTSGLYELGDFSSNTTKLYLVTAEVLNCKENYLALVSGYSCASNDYPMDNKSGCGLDELVLSHGDLFDTLQTKILDASNQVDLQDFCAPLYYDLEIHNGGDTQAKELYALLTLINTPGLTFNRFEYSNVYHATDSNPTLIFTPGSNQDVEFEGNNIKLPIGNQIELNTLERVQVKVYFDITSCEFKGGGHIKFSGRGNNVCDAEIKNTTDATSRRIFINGGPIERPELDVIEHTIAIDPVLNSGGNLRALYNIQIEHVGGNDPLNKITPGYKFVVTFPKDWVIVGSPEDYISPSNRLKYIGITHRGYEYEVISDIALNEVIRLANVPIKYNGADEDILDCSHNFGDISASIYKTFKVPDCTSPITLSCPEGIDQVVFYDSTEMQLSVDDLLNFDDAVQIHEICSPIANGSQPTIGDIVLENGKHLSWYENELDAQDDLVAKRIPSTTALVDGMTYYVINRFIADSPCKSNIGKFKIKFNTIVLKTSDFELICATDDQTYTIKVTLDGTTPFSVTGTGTPGAYSGNTWTSDPIAKGQAYNLTFTDAKNCTPLVLQGDAPECCTLKIECPADITVLCEAGYGPEITGYPAVLSSCGLTTMTHQDGPISACISGIKSFVRTFTVTDSKGNIQTCEQTISIEDKTAPVITIQAKDISVECSDNPEQALLNWLKKFGGAQATDACGSMVKWSHDYNPDNFVENCAATNGSVTVVFTAEDSCGNTAQTTAEFTVIDTKGPKINVVAQDLILECNDVNNQDLIAAWLQSNAGALATDLCGSTVTWSHDFTGITEGTCPNLGSALVTFSAKDACGNISTTAATILVRDTTDPVFIKKPENLVVECDGKGNRDQFHAWLANHGGAEAQDNCGTITWETTHIEDTNTICGITGTIIVDFIITDACGNQAMEQATFATKDTVAPTITKEASDLEIQCGVHVEDELNAWLSNFGGALATDSCGTVTWEHDYTGNLTVCGAPIEVTFTVTDACNNKSTTLAKVKVVDTQNPVLTKPAQDLKVSCDNDTELALTNWLANHAGAEASDSCSIVTWTHDYDQDNFVVTCGKAGSIEVSFTASDACGNTLTTKATFIVEDKQGPTFVEELPVGSLSVSCDAIPQAQVLTAQDNCGTATVVMTESKVGGLCANNYDLVRVWTATDQCGNTTTHTQTITVQDTTAPVFVEALPQNITVSCIDQVPTAETLTATDTCSDAEVVMQESKTDGTCGNNAVIKRTWTATDLCGNAISHTQYIIIADKTAPEFQVVPSDKTVECDGNGNEIEFKAWIDNYAGAQATDGCATDLTWTSEIVDTANLCGTTTKTTVRFTVTDPCGNSASKLAVFTIKDTVAPVIQTPASDLEIECGTNVDTQITNWLNNHGGAIATENCGGMTWSHNYKGLTQGCGTTGSAVVNFTVMDSCGNNSTTQATIRVVDTQEPVLVQKAQDLTISCEQDTQKALTNWLANQGGAKAKDSCSALTWSDNYDQANFVPSCGKAGSVEVIFTAQDDCGNVLTTTATFTIIDNTAPVVEIPAKNKTVECDGQGNQDAYKAWLLNNAGAIATDLCGTVTWTNDADTADFEQTCSSNTGSKEVRFTATDSCGNTASTVAVFTIVDTTAPVFTTAPVTEEVQCDGQGNTAAFQAWVTRHADAVVEETCSDLTWTHVIVNTDNGCGSTKSITVNFTATDSCGNAATKQGVFKIIDTQGPEITVPASDATVSCESNSGATELAAWLANNAGAKAKDACSGSVTWTNDFTGLDKACGSTGSATVVFTATDACGNESQTTATFTIIDDQAPVFTSALPKDMTLDCSAGIPEPAVVTAEDTCGSTRIELVEQRINGSCLGSYQIIRTWTATDTCGNSASHTQTISIEDTTAPVFAEPLPKAELYLACEDVKEAETLQAFDSCGKVEVVFTETKIQGECDNRYTLERTWTAIDSCANETSFTQTIHVACKIEFTNAISANGDGINDEFKLKGIECYPGNTVEIFNRWGKLVYTTTNYNSNGNVFKGYANTKHVVRSGEKLPTGTYFYVVKYNYTLGNGTTQAMDQSGYIHLESN